MTTLSNDLPLQPLINALRAQFPKHHLYVQIFPTGGVIDAHGCQDCGSQDDEFVSVGWRYHKGNARTFDAAVRDLQDKILGKS